MEKPAVNIPNTKGIPIDVLYQVFSYFNCRSCGAAMLVSKTFSAVGSDISFWRNLLLLEIKNFSPFNSIAAKSCRTKLKTWITRSFQWKLVGETTLCQARYLHRSACTKSGVSYVFGGDSSQFICFNDLWRVFTDESSLQIQFEKITPAPAQILATNFHTQVRTEPTPCSACALCALSEDLFIFGGFHRDNFPAFSNDFWRLRNNSSHTTNAATIVTQWELLSPTPRTESPGGRWGHSMVSFNNAIYLFGGSCPGQVYNDLWMTEISLIDTSGHVTWKKLNPPGAIPNARGGHSAVVVGHFMYIFGGNDLNTSYSDVWCLDLLDGQAESFGWELIQESDSSGPSPRIGHSTIAVGRHILIFGGRDFHKREFCTGVYLFDTDERSWEKLSVQYMNDARTGHCAIPCPSGILYFGGLVSESQSSSQVMHLDLFGASAEPDQSPSPSISCSLGTEETMATSEGSGALGGGVSSGPLTNLIRSLSLLPSMTDLLRTVRYQGYGMNSLLSQQQRVEVRPNYSLAEREN